MPRILVYTPLTPSGFHRLIWPAMMLQAAGYDVEIADANADDPLIRWQFDRSNMTVPTVPDCDILVIQGSSKFFITSAVNHWKSSGLRVVVDLDEDVRALNMPWIFADVLTVSTAALADRYGRRRDSAPVILRDCIPSAYLSHGMEPASGLIGWVGNIENASVVGASISRLQHSHGAELITIGGEAENVSAGFRLTRPPLIQPTGPMGDNVRTMACFTVGIAPLLKTSANSGVSWRTPLTYMALGVPCVASDMPEYQRLDGPMLARKVGHWYRHLQALLTHAGLRQEVAELGRKFAAAYTYEEHAELWWAAWTQ